MFFSTSRFIQDICLGQCCFICGTKPGAKDFNNEHILPEWLLRRYELFDKVITLPNEVTYKYGSYTIPCCVECNRLMGREIEKPISAALQKGLDGFNDYLLEGNLLKLFVWLGLIYLKTHLRDRTFRYHLDARKGTEAIADDYDWENLHHIHSVVRCFYNGCSVDQEAVGSLLVLPVNAPETREQFDFGDLYLAQSMFLRFDDIGIIAVLNDSGGAYSLYRPKAERIAGPVNELQLREIMVDMAYLNMHLKERPTFHSLLDLEREEYRIVAKRPELALTNLDIRIRGQLLHNAMKFALPYITVPDMSKEQVEDGLLSGRMSFLFDDEGQFIGKPWTPLPE